MARLTVPAKSTKWWLTSKQVILGILGLVIALAPTIIDFITDHPQGWTWRELVLLMFSLAVVAERFLGSEPKEVKRGRRTKVGPGPLRSEQVNQGGSQWYGEAADYDPTISQRRVSRIYSNLGSTPGPGPDRRAELSGGSTSRYVGARRLSPDTARPR